MASPRRRRRSTAPSAPAAPTATTIPPIRATGTPPSDSFYCNPAYDALYAKQATQTDPAERAETVKQMQQMLYDDAPYAVTFYYDDLQAYSGRFSGFVAQPPPKGALLFQYGTYSYRNIALAAAATDDEGGDGIPIALIGGITAIVGAAGVLGAVFLWRRRGDAMDTE